MVIYIHYILFYIRIKKILYIYEVIYKNIKKEWSNLSGFEGVELEFGDGI